MFSTFLSVIILADPHLPANRLYQNVENLYAVLANQFRDFEIIIVQNGATYPIPETLAELPDHAKAAVHGLQLNKTVSADVALLAGFDRANGDWAAALAPDFANQPALILELFTAAQQHQFDLITVQPTNNFLGLRLHKVWQGIYRLCGQAALKPPFGATALLSRRAISALQKLRQPPFDLPLAYAQTGFPLAYIMARLQPQHPSPVTSKFGRGWQRLLRATPFLHGAASLQALLAFANFSYILLGKAALPTADWQAIQFAWLWFIGSLILLALQRLWQCWRHRPSAPLYYIHGIQRIALNNRA